MEAIVSSVLGTLAEYTVAPVLRQFGYLIHYQSNIAHLDKQIEELIAIRDGVKSQTDAATKNLEPILPEVELWFARVDQTIQDKEKCFEKEKIAKAACCSAGWFPNLKVRHSLSRKAKKMTPDVDSLLNKKFETVASAVSPPELGVQPTQHSGDSNEGTSSSETSKTLHFESRKSTIEDIMVALKGKFNPIVVCGMGGVGKTTMVDQVLSKAKSMGLFNEYTKAVVNVKPDVSKIQSDIAEFLGLKFEELQGLEARANQLRKRLSSTASVLVVLDNVWETLDLQEIGIPSVVENCKILVTSRNQDIFNEMGEGRKIFPIGVLPKNDAWSLFKKVAGNDIESDPELRSIAEQVLKECGGLPVAISTLGSALRQKKTAFWKDALGLLREPFRGDIQGMKKNVYQPIRLSYDFLERNEAKSLFLLCGIFEESTDIPVDDLVTHGFGLGVFHGIDSVEGARDRVEALVDTLKGHYLLVDSDKEECVRMHDVVRDVGLEIASDESSQSTDGTFLIRHGGAALGNFSRQHNCTSLTTANKGGSHELLLVSLNKMYSEVVRLDAVNGTEQLKVLDVSSAAYGKYYYLTSIEISLESLTMRDIQTLCLRGLVLGSETISMIGEMRTLTTLRLAGSSIQHVPEEFKNLCSLKLLDLSDCGPLDNISPGVISGLSKLEELYLLNCFHFGALTHDKLTGLCSELLQLPSLTRLESPLGVVEGSMHLLASKLKRFRLYALGGSYDIELELFISQINPRGRDNMMILDHLGPDYSRLGLSELVKKSHCLGFSNDSLGRPFNEIDAECGANLKDLLVVHCDALEYLVDWTRTTETTPVVFPFLTELYISRATKLKEIFHGVLPVGSLKSLRGITIYYADELTHVWKTEGDQFDRLERLNLHGCESLQVIVAGHHEEELASDDQLNFPNLTHLFLDDLPRLVGITSRKVCKLNFSKLLELQLSHLPKFTGQWLNCLAPSSNSGDDVVRHLIDSKVDFPVLQSLEIVKMHNFEEIWHNQLSPYSVCELTQLTVDRCDKISHLVPTYMQNRLQKLEMIRVSKCSSLQEIFGMRISRVNEDERSRDTHSNVYQPDQGILQINSQSMILKGFQHLSELYVRECEGLRKVCSSSIGRSLVNLKFLSIENCYNMEEIVEAEEGEEAKDNNMFPCLAHLTLYDVPNLVSFSKHKYALDWPSMKRINIYKVCPGMKKFCSGSLTTSAEMEIYISNDVDENVRSEFEMSKRKA